MALTPTTYNTGNALESNSAKDLDDNARFIDAVANDSTGSAVIDRLGNSRDSLSKLEAQYIVTQINGGVWAVGIEFTARNQYMYSNGVPYKVKPSQALPYTTVNSDPTLDAGVEPFDLGITAQEAEDKIKEVTPTLTNLQAASVADMIAGVTIGGEVIPHEIGQVWGIYGQWKVKTISNPMTINDFAAVYAVNIKDFGAIGDGVADDTQAIQAALYFATANSSVVDAAHPWYGYVKLPTGRFRITDKLSVPRGIYIEGCNGKTTRLCTIVMDNTNNLPIFDLFGVEMPNGTRVADQRIQGIHFFNQNGHAIRAVAADYPNAVSHGSIEIHNNHFLNCNGDFAVQGEYIEIITGNTFDYAQVGHIKAKTLPNCHGNEFYRGIGGAIVLDTDLGSGGVLASLIVSNSFKECGTSSGANDSAIVLKGIDPLGAVSIVGNTFTGTGSGGIGALRTITEVDSLLFNSNMIDGLFGSVYATGRVNAASIQSNVISNTVGTGSSFPNVLFSDVGKASVQNNVFKDTANTLDISITLAEDGIVTGNLTDKYTLANNLSYERTDGTNLIKEYNTPVRYNFSDPNEAIANQSWFLGAHVFARMHSDGNQTVTWNNNPAVFYANKTSAGRSINAGGTINASGADYAEYMTKTADCGELTKGDICGITSDGLLTDKFSESITFVVKSTNPSYVGGDDWGTGLEDEALEEARNKVDRIAFCGQVPVNTSANVGDYIIPVVGDADTVIAASTQTPSFEEYLKALGRVIKVNDKPVIIVKTV